MDKLTLDNVIDSYALGWGIKKQRIYSPENKWRKYVLLEGIVIKLSNGKVITIEKGFEWDLSSVPRLFWSLLPPDGNWEIAALIHDYLYRNNIGTRKDADKEMLVWSMVVNRSKNKVSFQHLDNYTRYYAVRCFGNKAWNK